MSWSVLTLIISAHTLNSLILPCLKRKPFSITSLRFAGNRASDSDTFTEMNSSFGCQNKTTWKSAMVCAKFFQRLWRREQEQTQQCGNGRSQWVPLLWMVQTTAGQMSRASTKTQNLLQPKTLAFKWSRTNTRVARGISSTTTKSTLEFHT